MNDAPYTRDTSNTGSTLLGFALGAVIGAGLALLLAPDSGKNTRRRLASTAQRWRNTAEETFDQARDTVTDLGSDAKSAIKAGQDAFLHDRDSRESGNERRLSHAGSSGRNAVKHPGDEAAL